MNADLMLKSQFQIRANFQAINTAFAQNHVKLNNSEQQGKHSLLLFEPQSSDPTTTVGQVALYTKLVNSVPMLFYRPQSNATPIQMTYPSILTGLQSTDPNVWYPQQYSFVAGPFVVYAGIIIAATNGQTITLTPSSTLLYVQLTAQTVKEGQGVAVPATPSNISGNSFNINFNGLVGPNNFYYLAVGK
jgi:hypothetical protein